MEGALYTHDCVDQFDSEHMGSGCLKYLRVYLLDGRKGVPGYSPEIETLADSRRGLTW